MSFWPIGFEREHSAEDVTVGATAFPPPLWGPTRGEGTVGHAFDTHDSGVMSRAATSGRAVKPRPIVPH
jgi:hypothetical protein